MKVTLFCGKGGVGKSTCAVSLALRYSQKKDTAIIDYDGGHSVIDNLGITDEDVLNIKNGVFSIKQYLMIGVVENEIYQNILATKEQGVSFETYMEQFPGDLGIIPFADMISDFFGVPTDISTIQKFIYLVDMVLECKKLLVEELIIDVEPTAGLQRLLSHSDSMVRSLKNLKRKSKILLAGIAITWPDIAKYLKSDYIKNIDEFTSRIEAVATMLKDARYILVCTPEHIPVSQSFKVREMIEGFGGVVAGYVINNIRDEEHEPHQFSIIAGQKLPVAQINRNKFLHDENAENQRHQMLEHIGANIALVFH